MVKWRKLLRLIEKASDEMTYDDRKMPDVIPRCNEDHPLSIEDNFYCTICEQQIYPANERNFYKGYDLVREKSIINNDKITFVFEEADSKMAQGNESKLKKLALSH